jgi:hypothetical protein
MMLQHVAVLPEGDGRWALAWSGTLP